MIVQCRGGEGGGGGGGGHCKVQCLNRVNLEGISKFINMFLYLRLQLYHGV